MAERQDVNLEIFREMLVKGETEAFKVHDDGSFRFQDRLCVPANDKLKEKILNEAHNSWHSVHPGETKMYQDLKLSFWWNRMKKEVALYVAKCFTCQRVKNLHQRPAGLTQPLDVLEWKWESISLDFVMGLPTTQKGMNAIWVVVDRLTKSAHFLPIKNSRPVFQRDYSNARSF